MENIAENPSEAVVAIEDEIGTSCFDKDRCDEFGSFPGQYESKHAFPAMISSNQNISLEILDSNAIVNNNPFT